jgi:hypothetical protein
VRELARALPLALNTAEAGRKSELNITYQSEGWPSAGGRPMGTNAVEFGRREGYPVTCVAAHLKRPLVAFGYDGKARVAEVPGSRVLTVRQAATDREACVVARWRAAIGVGDPDGIVSLIDLSRRTSLPPKSSTAASPTRSVAQTSASAASSAAPTRTRICSR